MQLFPWSILVLLGTVAGAIVAGRPEASRPHFPNKATSPPWTSLNISITCGGGYALCSGAPAAGATCYSLDAVKNPATSYCVTDDTYGGNFLIWYAGFDQAGETALLGEVQVNDSPISGEGFPVGNYCDDAFRGKTPPFTVTCGFATITIEVIE